MKRFITMLMLLALITPSLSGCFGNFALTRKIYAVNASVADRNLRNVVTWAFMIVPVYAVAGAVDLFFFNIIEFWSGHNPVLASEKRFTYSSAEQSFEVLAVKKAATISFTIDRYRDGQYLDTLVINSDLSGDHAVAEYRQPGNESVFAALGSGNGLQAVSAGMKPAPGRTALSMLQGTALY